MHTDMATPGPFFRLLPKNNSRQLVNGYCTIWLPLLTKQKSCTDCYTKHTFTEDLTPIVVFMM